MKVTNREENNPPAARKREPTSSRCSLAVFLFPSSSSSSSFLTIQNFLLYTTTCYYSWPASTETVWVSRPGVCVYSISLPSLSFSRRIYPLSLLRPAEGSVCHGLPLRRQVSKISSSHSSAPPPLPHTHNNRTHLRPSYPVVHQRSFRSIIIYCTFGRWSAFHLIEQRWLPCRRPSDTGKKKET